VRLRPFRLHRPTTVEGATDLLDELSPRAQVYCGGTELLLVAKLGLTDFTELVDVKAIEELGGIEADGQLRIGAAATHRQIEHSPAVRERWPSLAAMERSVGNLRVRNVGTIGGNLCFADPHSDPATFLIAAGGAVSARRGHRPARQVDAEEFVRGPYLTALEPGELLLGVHVPAPAPGSALVHRKMSFHERPTITVAVNATVRDGRVTNVRIAAGSVGVRPLRLAEAERALIGLDAPARLRDLEPCADAAAREVEPVADAGGSIEYKRQLIRVLTRRCAEQALREAAADAQSR
jgi:aerobic carbon-monoxide dehydrogenase medium subunit